MKKIKYPFIAITFTLFIFFITLIAILIFKIIDIDLFSNLDGDRVLNTIKLTLYTGSISTLFAIIFAIPIGYTLSRYSFKGKTFVDTVLDLPLVISPIALGAMLLLFFNTNIGKVVENGLGGVVFSVKGIIIAQFFVVVGLAIRLLKEVFNGVDREYEIISKTLGYSDMETFYKITLPISKKGIISTILLVWGRAISEFGATITIAGATPYKTETIPIAIFLNFEAANLDYGIFFITILIFISLFTIFLTRTLFKN